MGQQLAKLHGYELMGLDEVKPRGKTVERIVLVLKFTVKKLAQKCNVFALCQKR